MGLTRSSLPQSLHGGKIQNQVTQKKENSSCGGSKIACGTKRSNNDSECCEKAMHGDTYPNSGRCGLTVSLYGWDFMPYTGDSGDTGDRGDREKSIPSLRHFSIINLKAGGSAPVRRPHYLKELKVLKCPSTASAERSRITHPYPPSCEDVQNTSLLCRTWFPLPHRCCMVLYLA